MKYIVFLVLASFTLNVNAYDFEDVTCSVVKEKTESTPRVITKIKIYKLKNMELDEARKLGDWRQKSTSTEFVNVEVRLINGIINKSYYRIIDGQLHQSFPSEGGEYIFRRIVLDMNSCTGKYEIVSLSGSFFQSSTLNNIRCEKNLF